MATYIGRLAGGEPIKLRGPSRQDAEDELRMKIGALWRDDWKSYYSVSIRKVRGKKTG